MARTFQPSADLGQRIVDFIFRVSLSQSKNYRTRRARWIPSVTQTGEDLRALDERRSLAVFMALHGKHQQHRSPSINSTTKLHDSAPIPGWVNKRSDGQIPQSACRAVSAQEPYVKTIPPLQTAASPMPNNDGDIS
jgi:hypothetical protein